MTHQGLGDHTLVGAAMADCKARLVREFLRTARPTALDAGCAADAPLPKFPPPA